MLLNRWNIMPLVSAGSLCVAGIKGLRMFAPFSIIGDTHNRSFILQDKGNWAVEVIISPAVLSLEDV